MKVYRSVEEFKKIDFPVVTTGTFDGVHLGHQKIINSLQHVAQQNGGETVLLTFYPHPRMVLFPDDNELKLLSTQEEKIMRLEKQGVNHLIIHPFTKEFSRLTSIEFVRNILVNKIGTKKLVIGYNHHFGRNREGSFEHLQEFGPVYGFDVEEISAIDVENIEVSSTKIRDALKGGDMSTANSYLGYRYSVEGRVVKGKQIGRTLGYPTANIKVNDKYKLIPADGIYAVMVEYKANTYKGMLSIGMNPTVNGTQKTMEVNIFEFDKDIYEETISIRFHHKIRNEEKFPNLEALKNQLHSDKQTTLNLLA